jgi:hypothetical protein
MKTSLFQMPLVLAGLSLILIHCIPSAEKSTEAEVKTTIYPSDVIPFMTNGKFF